MKKTFITFTFVSFVSFVSGLVVNATVKLPVGNLSTPRLVG